MSLLETNSGSLAASIVGGGGALTAAFWLIRSIVRRTSRDAVELAKDRAETNLVTMLSETNTRLTQQIDQLSKERNEALAVKGRLEATVLSYKARNEQLEKEAVYLRSLLASHVKHAAKLGEKP